jgi:hypothetical protein
VVAEAGDDDAAQAQRVQTEFFVEDLRLETFYRAGIDFQRGCAKQQGAEGPVEPPFRPGTDILGR